jgi:hypothetical protein
MELCSPLWPRKTGLYLTEEIEGMSAEEAAVVAFLRLRLGELAEKTAA